MTKSELDKWRKYVPWFIIATGLSPLLFLTANDPEREKILLAIIPIAAVVLAFFYLGTDLRGALWKKEMESHVGKRIRAALLEMIPVELGVNEAEREVLNREVYRDLTGVFWEAVERNDILRSQKEHFYSNGILYSTSLDVYILGVFLGLLHAIVSLYTLNPGFAYMAAACLAIAIASRSLVTPSRRKRHLELSEEQLDLLRRNELDYVSTRFREIVVGWRDRVSQVPPAIKLE